MRLDPYRYESEEWKILRARLIKEWRRCERCRALSWAGYNKETESPLQIHHTYYLRDKAHQPWDYPDSCFELLCRDCHEWTHKFNKIPIYDKHPTPGQFTLGLH